MAPDRLKLKTLNDNPYYTYEWTWAYGKILECFGVDPAAMTGFGADGGRQDKENDFQHVRGDFDGNPFVKEVLDHIERKTRLGEELLGRLV